MYDFSHFWDQTKLSVIERCLCYRSVRKERLDCTLISCTIKFSILYLSCVLFFSLSFFTSGSHSNQPC